MKKLLMLLSLTLSALVLTSSVMADYVPLANTVRKLKSDKALKVAVIGDSIAYGQISSGLSMQGYPFTTRVTTNSGGMPTGNPMSFARITTDYVKHLAKRDYDVADVNIDTFYSVWGGATAKSSFGYVADDIIARQPDLVFYEIWNDNDETLRYAENTLRVLWKTLPNTDVVLISVGGAFGKTSVYQPLVEKYGVKWIDAYADIQDWFGKFGTFHSNTYGVVDADGKVSGTRGYLFGNGHPHVTEEGYIWFCDRIVNSLETFFASAADASGATEAVAPAGSIDGDPIAATGPEMYHAEIITPASLTQASGSWTLTANEVADEPRDTFDRVKGEAGDLIKAAAADATLTRSVTGNLLLFRGSKNIQYKIGDGEFVAVTDGLIVNLADGDDIVTVDLTLKATAKDAYINEFYVYGKDYQTITPKATKHRYSVKFYAKIAPEYYHDWHLGGEQVIPHPMSWVNCYRMETYGAVLTLPGENIISSQCEKNGAFLGWVEAEGVERIGSEVIPLVATHEGKTIYAAGATIDPKTLGRDVTLVAAYANGPVAKTETDVRKVTFVSENSGNMKLLKFTPVYESAMSVTTPDLIPPVAGSTADGWKVVNTDTVYPVGAVVPITTDTEFIPVYTKTVAIDDELLANCWTFDGTIITDGTGWKLKATVVGEQLKITAVTEQPADSSVKLDLGRFAVNSAHDTVYLGYLIDADVFKGKTMTCVVDLGYVTKIGKAAFMNTGIKDVRIGKYFVEMSSAWASGAFYGCASLTNVVFEQGGSATVTINEAFTFENCSALQSLDCSGIGYLQCRANYGQTAGCSALTNVIIRAPSKIDKDFFSKAASVTYHFYGAAPELTSGSLNLGSGSTTYVHLDPESVDYTGQLASWNALTEGGVINGKDSTWKTTVVSGSRPLLLINEESQEEPVVSTVTVENGQTIGFMGDSITYFGYTKSRGWVNLVLKGLKMMGYTDLSMVRAGVRGNTSANMLARVDDVLAKKPDWMTFSCGVNDVDLDPGCTFEEYKSNVSAVFDRADAAGVKILAMTPTPIHERRTSASAKNTELDEFVTWYKSEATRRGYLIADQNAAITAKITELGGPSNTGWLLTEDGIHMDYDGDLVMALTVLRQLGFQESMLDEFLEKAQWVADPPANYVKDISETEKVAVYTELGEGFTFVAPANMASASVLVVGGGGAGGGISGGGGGAGQYIYQESAALVAGKTYRITVGDGGKTTNELGSNGGDSSIVATDDSLSIVAIGGGYGSGGYNTKPGGNGGNGGGGLIGNIAGGTSTVGGYAGGTSSQYAAGGGGGAGGAGANGGVDHANKGGNGGPGVVNNITGDEVVYAAGGGGSAMYNAATYYGIGGANDGYGNAYASDSQMQTGGRDGTGGGGGGGKGNDKEGFGGRGGSGIVAIRYTLSSSEPAVVDPEDPEEPEEIDTRKQVEINPYLAQGVTNLFYMIGDDERVYIYRQDGSFRAPSNMISADMIVVGGGGAGGGNSGGGGGGGQFVSTNAVPFVARKNYAVTIGLGGTTSGTKGNNGGTTSVEGEAVSIVAIGGGGGGGNWGGSPGCDGANGGGAGGAADQVIPGKGIDGGFDGGTTAMDGNPFGTGGGGGAGGDGVDATTTKGGDGGPGAVSSITGYKLTYAYGGGGVSRWGEYGHGGAMNGAGDGWRSDKIPATAGEYASGGGGGGGKPSGGGGAGEGGSGVVVIRVKLDMTKDPEPADDPFAPDYGDYADDGEPLSMMGPTATETITVTFATAAEAESATMTIAPLSGNKPVAFTSRWDDSNTLHLEKAQMYNSIGLTPCFFLNQSDNYGPTIQQLKALGARFGNHTYSHPFLTQQDANHVFYEVVANKIWIESQSDMTCTTFAIPYNWGNEIDDRCHARIAKILVDSGTIGSSNSPMEDSDQPPSEWIPGYNFNIGDDAPRADQFWTNIERGLASIEADGNNYPKLTLGTHSSAVAGVCDTQKGLLLELMEKHPDWWYTDDAHYAAYRYEYWHSASSIVKTGVDGNVATFSIKRYDPAFVGVDQDLTYLFGDLTPVSVEVSGGFGPETALPAKIDTVDADGNSTEFPGLNLTFSVDETTGELKYEFTGDKTKVVAVLINPSPMWANTRIFSREASATVSLGAKSEYTEYLSSDHHYCVGVDFVRNGRRGRLYAFKTVENTDPVANNARDNALTLGPLAALPADEETWRASSVPGVELQDVGTGFAETWRRTGDQERMGYNVGWYISWDPGISAEYKAAYAAAGSGVRQSLVAIDFTCDAAGEKDFLCNAGEKETIWLWVNGVKMELTGPRNKVPVVAGANRIIYRWVWSGSPEYCLVAVCDDEDLRKCVQYTPCNVAPEEPTADDHWTLAEDELSVTDGIWTFAAEKYQWGGYYVKGCIGYPDKVSELDFSKPFKDSSGNAIVIKGFDYCFATNKDTPLTPASERVGDLRLGSQALQNCVFTGCVNLNLVGGFPQGLTAVGMHAFMNSGLSGDLELPYVTDIQRAAFKGTAITSVKLGAGLKTFADAYDTGIFQSCVSLTNVTFDPASTVTVSGGEGYSFSGCTSLKTIDLSGVAVLKCNSSADKSLFKNCKALEKVTTSNLTSVTKMVFSGSKVSEYHFYGAAPTLTDGQLDLGASGAVTYVHLTDDAQLDGWKALAQDGVLNDTDSVWKTDITGAGYPLRLSVDEPEDPEDPEEPVDPEEPDDPVDPQVTIPTEFGTTNMIYMATANEIVYAFYENGTFTVPSIVSGTARILVVGGGGGGGCKGNATGGGGGAVVYNDNVALTSGQEFTVTIGVGGSGVWGAEVDGGDSSFVADDGSISYVAAGGKSGTKHGGASGNGNAAGGKAQYAFGGGGGAGGAGGDGDANEKNDGGVGGVAVTNDILGVAHGFGAGGGGGQNWPKNNNEFWGWGGNHDEFGNAYRTEELPNTHGRDGFGGGGGGGHGNGGVATSEFNGGAVGGKGCVIVRFAINDPVPEDDWVFDNGVIKDSTWKFAATIKSGTAITVGACIEYPSTPSPLDFSKAVKSLDGTTVYQIAELNTALATTDGWCGDGKVAATAAGLAVSALTLPNDGNLTAIGTGAFGCLENCTSATPLVPDSVATMGRAAFHKLPVAADVRLASVVKVDTGLFLGSAIKSVWFGPALKNICGAWGAGCFYKCTSLTNVSFDAGISNAEFADYEGHFDSCSGLVGTLDLRGFTKLAVKAPFNGTKITEVLVGDGVTEVGTAFFNGMSKLNKVRFAGAVPTTLVTPVFGNISADQVITSMVETADAALRADWALKTESGELTDVSTWKADLVASGAAGNRLLVVENYTPPAPPGPSPVIPDDFGTTNQVYMATENEIVYAFYEVGEHTFTVPDDISGPAQILVVGGGGAGGPSGSPCGGGGGAVVSQSGVELTKGAKFTVTVGDGGAIAYWDQHDYVFSGGTSSLVGTGDGALSVSAVGGVGGYRKPGASGNGKAGGVDAQNAKGGGGGAAGVGGDGNANGKNDGGVGGIGVVSSIRGTEVMYGAGGGGGQVWPWDHQQYWGWGGANDGYGNAMRATQYPADARVVTVATPGRPGAGGGGGGGYWNSAGKTTGYVGSLEGGLGGSGCVIIRFAVGAQPKPRTGLMLIIR